jgi:hypothetical protein
MDRTTAKTNKPTQAVYESLGLGSEMKSSSHTASPSRSDPFAQAELQYAALHGAGAAAVYRRCERAQREGVFSVNSLNSGEKCF